jgi:hypothetical protein
MSYSLERVLNKEKLFVVRQRYDSFGISYHSKLSNIIEQITSELDLGSDDESQLKHLSKALFENINYKEDSLYPRDILSEHPTANCVGYATAFVYSLKYIGRDDLLDKVGIKSTYKHVWLEIDLKSGLFKFNSGRHNSSKTHKIHYLELLNKNALGNELVKNLEYEKALKLFENLGTKNSNFTPGKTNLKRLLIKKKEGFDDRIDFKLVNPKCTNNSITYSTQACVSSAFGNSIPLQNSFDPMTFGMYNNNFESTIIDYVSNNSFSWQQKVADRISVPDEIRGELNRRDEEMLRWCSFGANIRDFYTDDWESFVPKYENERSYNSAYDRGYEFGSSIGEYSSKKNNNYRWAPSKEESYNAIAESLAFAQKMSLPLTASKVGYGAGFKDGYELTKFDSDLKRANDIKKYYKDLF